MRCGFPLARWAGFPITYNRSSCRNLYRLWQQSACFHNHYTAATACSPARASLITGLYAHQHFLLSTVNRNSPLLNPAFPTYGSLLSTMGYDCYWWGKFHLAKLADANLSAYGFAGKERYDPIGYPGEGLNGQIDDQEIANQFVSWLNARRAAKPNRPFCTTVSFINPHDIEYFPRQTGCFSNKSPPFLNFDVASNFLIPTTIPRSSRSQTGARAILARTSRIPMHP